MATAAVLQPRDMNMPFNLTVVVSASRVVPRSTVASGRPPSSSSCGKSHRRRRGRSVDARRQKKTEKKAKDMVMEKVRILKRGEKLCPNLVKCSGDVNKKNEVMIDRFAGNGFTMAPPASDLPMPMVNWLHKSEENIKIADVDLGAHVSSVRCD